MGDVAQSKMISEKVKARGHMLVVYSDWAWSGKVASILTETWGKFRGWSEVGKFGERVCWWRRAWWQQQVRVATRSS